jgi:UDP-N-acetylglucosamine--N-acetylmuramyl-(pentapeptide) pyrophosphoryl-undecaprenol N-acetylglucosamine transferase
VSGNKSALSVVVAGGGTAGHIEPALAVADAVKAAQPDTRITALGTARGLETTLVPARGYILELIPPVPLPRKPTMDLVKLPTRILASVRKTREVLDSVDADVIVGFGGYVALPAYLAARGGVLRRRRKIPIVIHEANASAGIANKIGARLATRVLAAVPGSGVKNRGDQDAEIVGIPVRASIANFDSDCLRTVPFCSSSADRKARSRSTTRCPEQRKNWRRPGSRSFTHTDPRTPSRSRSTRRRHRMWLYLIFRGWISRMPQPTRRSVVRAR